MLLHVFGHVEPDHGALVVKQELCQRPRCLGLADSGRAKKNERPDRPIRILQTGPRAPHGIGDGAQGFVLADYALAQAFFHRHQFLHLAFEHLGNRYTGPLRHYFGDIFFVDLFLEHHAVFLKFRQLRTLSRQLGFELRNAAVLQF